MDWKRKIEIECIKIIHDKFVNLLPKFMVENFSYNEYINLLDNDGAQDEGLKAIRKAIELTEQYCYAKDNIK